MSLQVGGVIFFQPASLQVQPHPTKRAVDGRDSAAFSGFFYTRTESCSWSFIYARPTAANANHYARQMNNSNIGDCK